MSAQRTGPHPSCVFLVCSACLLLTGRVYSQEVAAPPKTVLVVSQDAQLQVGEQVIARLTPGDIAPVTHEQGNWLWIQLGNVGGWVLKQHVLPYGDALASANEAVNRNAGRAAAHVTRGLVWYTKGEYEKAITDFTEAIRLDADYARAYADRGNAWAAKGDLRRAMADYDAALRLAPSDALTLNNRAIARIELGDYEGAIADLTSAIRHYRPQAVTIEASAKQPAKARARLWVVRYFIHRGLARERAGDFRRALSDYGEALRLDPKDPAAHFGQGNVWFHQLQFERAIEGYTQAIALEANDARTYRNRGWAYFHNQQYAEAAKDFATAVRLEPGSAAAYDALAWLRATCPMDEFRSGEKAVEFATKACELTKWEKPSYLETLAAAYAESGQFDTAVTWQRKALDMVAETEKTRTRSRLERYESKRPLRHEPIKK